MEIFDCSSDLTISNQQSYHQHEVVDDDEVWKKAGDIIEKTQNITSLNLELLEKLKEIKGEEIFYNNLRKYIRDMGVEYGYKYGHTVEYDQYIRILTNGLMFYFDEKKKDFINKLVDLVYEEWNNTIEFLKDKGISNEIYSQKQVFRNLL